MTLTKTCRASKMIQDLHKATYRLIATTKAFCIAMFQCSIVVLKKIESHLETLSSDAQRINLKFVPYGFVANFVSCISAKYYCLSNALR